MSSSHDHTVLLAPLPQPEASPPVPLRQDARVPWGCCRCHFAKTPAYPGAVAAFTPADISPLAPLSRVHLPMHPSLPLHSIWGMYVTPLVLTVPLQHRIAIHIRAQCLPWLPLPPFVFSHASLSAAAESPWVGVTQGPASIFDPTPSPRCCGHSRHPCSPSQTQVDSHSVTSLLTITGHIVIGVCHA